MCDWRFFEVVSSVEPDSPDELFWKAALNLKNT